MTEPLMATCGGCGRIVLEDREPCPTCGSTTRNITRTMHDSLTLHDTMDVKTGTAIHLPMMVAAEQARDRCQAAAVAGHDVLTDAMVAVLLAAVALEAGIYWVADELDKALLDDAQLTQGLEMKWRLVAAARPNGIAPSLGGRLGQAVRQLGIDRGVIAHYPGKDRRTLATPLPKNQGMTEARATFTLNRAVASVDTAAEALHAIGVHWAEAITAPGRGTANDATGATSG